MQEISKDYDRVTSIIFPFSGLDKIPSDVLNTAAKRGERVHQVIDSIILKMGRFEDEGIEGYIDSFERWFSTKKEVRKVPRFYCNDLWITGECDAIYPNENGYTLVDFKTPIKEGKTWHLQGGAYSHLAKKNDLNITNIEFVQLMRSGEEPKIYSYEDEFLKFYECLKMYRIYFKNSTESFLDYL